MKWQILYRSQAFGPGSHLWFIAGPSTSSNTKKQSKYPALTNKIDWYLNFQLTRSRQHKPHVFSNTLKNIINENNLPTFTKEISEPKPLMIIAKEQFPTSAVIEMPVPKNMQSWPQNIHDIWQRFEQPSLRVFLPEEISAEEFKALWPKSNKVEMTLVPA